MRHRHPYDQGYLDYDNGYELWECPYGELFHYEFYLDWKEGWLDAEEDDLDDR